MNMFTRNVNIATSAAQGAVFGIMAMRFVSTLHHVFFSISFRTFSMQNVDIKATAIGGNANASAGANNNTPKGTPVGGIVGGVIGGLALLLVITGAIFFCRRRMQQAEITLGPGNKDYFVLRPFGTQVIPVSLNNHYQNKTLMKVGCCIPKHILDVQPSSEPEYSMKKMNLPTPALVPLASKEREVLQQNELPRRRHSAVAMVVHAGPSHVPEHGRGEILRAEVDDLRREVEAMRNIAQPPTYVSVVGT
jgi:hypothetical protein